MNTSIIIGTAAITMEAGDIVMTAAMVDIVMAEARDIIKAADIVADTTESLQIFLCRHGETEWTLSGQHTSFTDIPLTEKGKMQAVLLGKRLRGVAFHRIIVSPMRRAVETCELAAPHHHKILEPNAMEWNYGSYEGMTRQQILEKDPHWSIFDDGAPDGESPDEVSARADHLLRSLHKETGIIAIFSHGHFARALAARWLHLPVQSGKCFALSVASLSILGFERDQHVIKLWNDTGYL